MERMFAEVNTDERDVLHNDPLRKEKPPASIPLTEGNEHLIRVKTSKSRWSCCRTNSSSNMASFRSGV